MPSPITVYYRFHEDKFSRERANTTNINPDPIPNQEETKQKNKKAETK